MPVLTLEKALADARRGKPAPVYLLHGDEYLTREGARALIDALVPAERQSMSVEVLGEEAAQAALAPSLATLPLFGGTKVAVVHDIRAFAGKQTKGDAARKSFQAWSDGDTPRATRLLLQALGALGADAAFLARAARGDVPPDERRRLLDEEDADAERWVQELAARAVADRLEIPRAAGSADVYERILETGVPPGACLILTAELVDERRTLFRRIRDAGAVIDCGVRGRSAWETQMRPEAARARIAEAAAAGGKTMEEGAVRRVLEQTGFSVRALESELQKVFLFVGERRTVTAADVDAVLVSSREVNIVVLANAVSDRDPARALHAYRSLVAQREPALRLLATLAGEVRGLLVARAVLEERLPGAMEETLTYPAFQARILPRLKGTGPAAEGAAQLLDMHPFRAFNILRAAARFSPAELRHALDRIHEADLQLKTSGQPDALLLEPLILSICARE
jgi:DNA polymerase-3 subunit delta